MAKALREAQAALEHGNKALKQFPQEAVDSAKELATQARDEARQWVDQAKEQACGLSDSLANWVRDKPFRSLSIALGIGCAMGLVIARRHR